MSARPGLYNFAFKQPTWSDSITWSIANVPVNMTGYTVTLRLRWATGDETFSTAEGVTGSSLGVVSWNLDASSWPVGFVDYDIKAVAPNGTVNWLLAGVVEVES